MAGPIDFSSAYSAIARLQIGDEAPAGYGATSEESPR